VQNGTGNDQSTPMLLFGSSLLIRLLFRATRRFLSVGYFLVLALYTRIHVQTLTAFMQSPYSLAGCYERGDRSETRKNAPFTIILENDPCTIS